MKTKQIPWHALSLNETKERLLADFNRGLDEKEVLKRQKHYGKNAFESKKQFYYLTLLWKQIKNPLVFILIIAALITFFLKEYTNTIVIFIAVFINTAIGMIQEGKASQAFDKLKSSQKKFATVLREGRQKVIEAIELVPGDIIILQMGDRIPADSRLVEGKGLEANESILTGEWLSIKKDPKAKIKEEAHISDKNNMVWMGSLITEGWGKAVAVNTGSKTEMGEIAEVLKEGDDVITPLQKGIKHLARFLGLAIVLILSFIFVIGIIRGEPLIDMLLISVALAVSAIPEGLPAAVTVVLAIGMERILSKGGLVKNLNAAETLGSSTLILTDKTGTLTKAEMNVSRIMTYFSENKEFENREHKDRLEVLQMALLASNSFIENPEDELKEWKIRGGPMDKAILMASIEGGLRPVEIFKKSPRVDFIPFDSERRFSASLYKNLGDDWRIYMMGAPELILGLCDKIYAGGKELKIGEKEFNLLKRVYEKETSSGARILGIAYKNIKEKSFPHDGEEQKKIFEKMVFGGFIGFHDPLREDVPESIKMAQEAFVRPVMATGDYAITAQKIAQEIGLMTKGGLLLEGEKIEKMSDQELENIVEKVDVFARVLPHQKMRIIKAWQSKGEVVAMTGDGVNDAPALKHADIGLALGSGTDVAKEASDIVLLNNSFSIIVYAIEEGRRILDNLRKIIAYLLSTSFSEIVLIGVAVILGFPLPVLPAQILWINIIQEGFMNFAFAFEPKEKDLMKRNPKTKSPKKILTPKLKKMIFIVTLITSVLLTALYFFFINYFSYSIEKIRTIMFAAISVSSIFFAFSFKNLKKPIWKIKIFSNRYLIFAFMTSLLLLLTSLFVPILQKLLSLVTLSFSEILILLAFGLLNFAVIETVKYFLFEKEIKL
ncbi:HAD-IC family P-type ATPase [Patescibacteria group bacterium]|nr:HAD-IC family P-type ATPase [Patescibacteria group bacterium]